jgi:RNA polymerase sigma-70 factor (ECF subfamily)
VNPVGARGVWLSRSEVLLDDTMSAIWAGPVSLDPALEREFEERIADSSTLAFRVALSVLRRREDAEDVAQDAFLRARRAFAGLRDRERFRAWVVRTSFRLALDRLRGEKRRVRREDALAAEAPVHADSAEAEAAKLELRQGVAAAVAQLPEKLRIVTLLAAIEEHDLASVARLLELPEGTVKSRLHRARRLLAERLRWLVSDTAKR